MVVQQKGAFTASYALSEPRINTNSTSSELEKGSLEITNITTSEPTSGQGERAVKTVVKGRGEPGYFLTAGMMLEQKP